METNQNQTPQQMLSEITKNLPIAQTLSRLPLARQVVALSYALRDPDVPMAKKIGIGACLAYVVSPIDVIPDFVPLLGYLDDIVAIGLAVKLAKDIITEEHLSKADQVFHKANAPKLS
jgi:uncharacterized membrane protein YkvA (DUF1232 family)